MTDFCEELTTITITLKSQLVSGRHTGTYNSLQSCFTISSWIQLIHLMKGIKIQNRENTIVSYSCWLPSIAFLYYLCTENLAWKSCVNDDRMCTMIVPFTKHNLQCNYWFRQSICQTNDLHDILMWPHWVSSHRERISFVKQVQN